MTVISRKKNQYKHPFLDLATVRMPDNFKSMLDLCYSFYYATPLAHSILNKLAEYPITDFIYKSSKDLDDHQLKYYKDIFEGKLKLKIKLLETRLNYYVGGNVVCSIYIPFRRYIECTTCGEKTDSKKVSYRIHPKSKDELMFQFKCPTCGENRVGIGSDITVNRPNEVNIVRWSLKNVTPDYNPVSGQTDYYYRIPNKIRTSIVNSYTKKLDEYPLAFIQSAFNRQDLLLDSDNLYVEKRPGLDDEDMAWGKPALYCVLKELQYIQTLKAFHEAVANQHIMPLDFLFPTSSGGVNPFGALDLAKWRDRIEEEIDKWKRDPNYVSIMPIPMGVSRLGGDARALLITPELESSYKLVAAGLGVPLELIFGGLSFSGSSVSIRILENHFLTTRQFNQDFLDWIVSRTKEIFRLPKDFRIEQAKFKMADDVQQKQLVFSMNQANKISDEDMLPEFGFSAFDQQEKIRKQLKFQNDINRENSIAQAHAQGEANKVMANYDLEMRKMQIRQEEELQQQTTPGGPMGPPPPNEMPPEEGGDMQYQQEGEGAVQEQANPVDVANMRQQQNPNMRIDYLKQVRAIVEKIESLDPTRRQEFLNELSQKLPKMKELVDEYMMTGTIQRGDLPQPTKNKEQLAEGERQRPPLNG